MLCWEKYSRKEQTKTKQQIITEKQTKTKNQTTENPETTRQPNTNISVPLQVRSPYILRKPCLFRKKLRDSVSRVFPFTSLTSNDIRRCNLFQKNLPENRSRKASMTLEAAFTLSLLIFASVSLMLPAKIMVTERKMQAGLEAAGEDLSQFAYLLDSLKNGKEENIISVGETDKAFSLNAEEAAAPLYARMKVLSYCDTKNVSHVSMLRSSIRKDEEILDLVMEYDISMPFPVLGLPSLHRTIRCRRRCWTGREGRYGESDGKGNEDEKIVYVGRNSTRYHPDRTCHYLANRLTPIAWENIDGKRNTSGGKYYPCSACAKNVGKGSTVYIAASGARYHSRQDCKSITAYARAVKLKDVKYLGACSYCGGRSGA